MTRLSLVDKPVKPLAICPYNFVRSLQFPPRYPGPPKTASSRDIENLLTSCGFEIIESRVLGNDVKSCYVKGQKE